MVQYNETMGSLVYPGSQSSVASLQPLVLHAEALANWRPHQCPHIWWRLDSGFGSDSSINWLLPRRYQLLVKGYSQPRAKKVALAQAASSWCELGQHRWVTVGRPGVRYARQTQTLALKWRGTKQKEKYALLIHTLLDDDPAEVVHYYDARGGMEVEIKEDKLGLQLIKRRKHHWHAQVAWVILTDIAHNLLTWLQHWMLSGSTFEHFGNLRLVQDVLSVPGYLEFGGPKGDKLIKVALQKSHPYAAELVTCLNSLFRNLK